MICLCLTEERVSTSKEKSTQASLYGFNIFTAASSPLGRHPLYTLLNPPFPIRFSITQVYC